MSFVTYYYSYENQKRIFKHHGSVFVFLRKFLIRTKVIYVNSQAGNFSFSECIVFEFFLEAIEKSLAIPDNLIDLKNLDEVYELTEQEGKIFLNEYLSRSLSLFNNFSGGNSSKLLKNFSGRKGELLLFLGNIFFPWCWGTNLIFENIDFQFTEKIQSGMSCFLCFSKNLESSVLLIPVNSIIFSLMLLTAPQSGDSSSLIYFEGMENVVFFVNVWWRIKQRSDLESISIFIGLNPSKITMAIFMSFL